MIRTVPGLPERFFIITTNKGSLSGKNLPELMHKIRLQGDIRNFILHPPLKSGNLPQVLQKSGFVKKARFFWMPVSPLLPQAFRNGLFPPPLNKYKTSCLPPVTSFC